MGDKNTNIIELTEVEYTEDEHKQNRVLGMLNQIGEMDKMREADKIAESKKAKLIINDEVIDAVNMNSIAYESQGINISVFHIEEKGFTLSVLDRETNIMSYYDVVNGQLQLSEREHIETGEKIC